MEQLGEILNGPAVEAVSEPVDVVSEPVEAVSEPVEAKVPEASLKQENVRVEEKKDAKSGKVWRGIVVAAVVLVATAVVVIGGFIVLAHIAPAFVDSLLYTPEELQIINYRL